MVYLGLKEKDPKKQIEYYSKCLELDPKNAVAWNNKGFALYKLGRYEEAIRCYDTALGINPEDAIACDNKIIVEEKLLKIEKLRRKVEQWKREGYKVDDLEEMLK